MVDWWVADILNNPQLGFPYLLGWCVVVIGSITLHELAHGWAAVRLGDQTPVITGHMTWNPLVHMGGLSLIVFAAIGIAWGAMPIDPSRLRGRHGVALVTLAGPAMNLALAFLGAVFYGLWVALAPRVGVTDPLYTNFVNFFQIGVVLNLVLCLFNLMPVLPLDGGRVLAEYWPAYARFGMSENGRWVMLGVFVLLFWIGTDLIFGVAFSAGGALLGAIGSVVGGPTP